MRWVSRREVGEEKRDGARWSEVMWGEAGLMSPGRVRWSEIW